MARIKVPLLSIRSWGTIAKSLTFRRRKALTDALKTPFPTDAKTAIQRTQRLLFQDAVAWWHDLTTEEKLAYDKPGREHHMSGYAWFIRSYLLNPPAATFLSLTDTPGIYTGEAGHPPIVNPAEDALIWGTVKEFPSGIVSLPGQSAASVWRSGIVAVPPITWTKILWNNEFYDTQNEFNLITHTFTAEEYGLYMVNFQVALLSMMDGNFMQIRILKNLALPRENKMCAAANFITLACYVPWAVELDAGDTLDFYVYYTGGATSLIGDAKWTWATVDKTT